MKRLSHAGDTLVEVLLAIAVLSGIMGITYAIANRAQRNTQLSQQRAEATGVAQTQVERLRAIRDSSTVTRDNFPNFFSSFTGAANPFCIESLSTPPVSGDLKDATLPANCGFGTNDRYRVRTVFDSTRRQFTVSVSWTRPDTPVPSQVSMDYRLW